MRGKSKSTYDAKLIRWSTIDQLNVLWDSASVVRAIYLRTVTANLSIPQRIEPLRCLRCCLGQFSASPAFLRKHVAQLSNVVVIIVILLLSLLLSFRRSVRLPCSGWIRHNECLLRQRQSQWAQLSLTDSSTGAKWLLNAEATRTKINVGIEEGEIAEWKSSFVSYMATPILFCSRLSNSRRLPPASRNAVHNCIMWKGKFPDIFVERLLLKRSPAESRQAWLENWKRTVSSSGWTNLQLPMLSWSWPSAVAQLVEAANAAYATEVTYLALRLVDIFHTPILELRKTTNAIQLVLNLKIDTWFHNWAGKPSSLRGHFTMYVAVVGAGIYIFLPVYILQGWPVS